MPQFPIAFSNRTPPAASQSVRASLDTDTGNGFAGRALIGAGAELQEIGGKIQAAQDSTEFDTMKRKYAEAKNALAATLDTSTDVEANRKALDEFSKQMEGMQASNGRVGAAYKSFLANRLPEDQGAFQWANLKLQRKNIEAESQVNEQHLLQTGDQLGYNVILDKKATLGIEAPAKIKALKEAFPVMAAMTQAGTAYTNGNYALASEKLAKVDVSKLTPEQQGHYRMLQNGIEQDSRRGAADDIIAVETALTDLTPKSSKERIDAAPQLYATLDKLLRNKQLTEDQYTVKRDRIARMVAGTKIPNDSLIEAGLDKRISEFTPQTDSQDVDSVRQQISEADELSPSGKKRLLSHLDTNLKTQMSAALKASIEDVATKRGMTPGGVDEMAFRREAEAWHGQLKSPLSPAQVYQHVSEMGALHKEFVKPKTGTELFSPATRERNLGAIETKGSATEALGTAIERFGPTWWLVEPRAIDALRPKLVADKVKWPLPPVAKNLDEAEQIHAYLLSNYLPHAGAKDSYDIGFTNGALNGQRLPKKEVGELLDKAKLQVDFFKASAPATPVDPMEGRTATMPDGSKIIRRNGAWIPMK